MENKRDPEKNPRSLYPVRFALAPAGVPGLGASPGVWVETRHLTEAVTAVAALEFSAVDIEAYLRGSADFALATIDWYAKFVNLLLYSAADVSTSPNTLTALASTLLLLFRNEAGAVMATNNLLKITQSELAALLGVDRASLVRALSALRKKGAVATLRGAIKLLSPEILQQAAARS